jgi:O-antigen/teichoic acid export membrane protein
MSEGDEKPAGWIRHDLAVSHLSGPLRILLPTLAVFVTYPVLLHRAGLDVVGLWSILSTVIAYTGLLDIGFTNALTRAMAAEHAGFDMGRLASWRRCAALVYLVGGAALVAVAAGVGAELSRFGVAPEHRRDVGVGLVALTAATVCQLLAKLELTVFRAHHRTFVEQWALSLTTTATYLAGLVGAYLDHPILFLTFGSLAANVVLYLSMRSAARRTFSRFFATLDDAARPVGIADLRDLIQHGKHFFSLSVAFVVREPVFRLIVASLLGASAVGVYDIANRVPMLVRELGASGSQALFAGLARLDGQRGWEPSLQLLKTAMFYLLAIGGTGLAVFAVGRDFILSMWLGTAAIQSLRAAALLMAIWWAITLVNVPFFWLLQARRLERPLALSVWLHTASLFVVVLAARASLTSLTSFLWVWILTGVATQFSIYWIAERETGLTKRLLLDGRVVGYALGAVLTVAAGVWWSDGMNGPGSGISDLTFVVAWLCLYSIACGPALWGLRPKRATPG